MLNNMEKLTNTIGKIAIYTFATIGILTQLPYILSTVSKLLIQIAK